MNNFSLTEMIKFYNREIERFIDNYSSMKVGESVKAEYERVDKTNIIDLKRVYSLVFW